jgi:diketogulonate reductase-like aldo/keto reductase
MASWPCSRTANPDRVVENLTVFDFELRDDEMAAIQTLARPTAGSSIRLD